MLKSYIQLALRSLAKNKVASVINILGLTIGLTCCLLIALYVLHEFSYDTHQQYADRLYQLGTTSRDGDIENRYATTPAPMAPTMEADYPEVVASTRLLKTFEEDKTLLQYTQNGEVRSFYEGQGYLADSNFFQLFTYNFKEGNPATALAEPNSVVLTEEIADKLFGGEPALNKTIHINSTTNGAQDFKVTGVFIPARTPTHIDARFVMSMRGGDVGQWLSYLTDYVNNNMFYSYLLLAPGADPRKLETKFEGFIKQYAGADLEASGRNRQQFLTPVRDIHLYAKTEGNVTPGGSVGYLYLLISIAFVTILIACVNFMNLATARSSKRAMEIGVRKVLGAERSALVRQFLLEAVMLALVAFVLSLGLAVVLAPGFENLLGRSFTFTPAQQLAIVAGFLLVALLTGVMAGIYPAFYLSAFKPVKVLKGAFANSLAAISFRKALVVFQFVVAVALIVASITIGNQMQYLRTKDLGFEKDQQVIIPLRTSTAKTIYPSLKNELLANPAISSVGASIYYPGIANVTDWLLYKQGNSPDQTRTVYMNRVDPTYLQTLEIEPVAGRLFSTEMPADTNNRIILNEEAIREFEFASPEDAIGKNIVANWGGEENLFNIVGVVKNFHFKELHSEIESYGFLLNRRPYYNYLIAHANPGDMRTTLNSLEATWKELNPNEPFEYSFLDQDFQKNYVAEDRLATIIRYFTIVAIFISCLGLFGLTTFSVEQRTREIGIRKVLGATTAGIVSLLSKDFLKLVAISFVVAAPLAWYFVNRWLENFAYKAPFTIWIVALGCALALVIAFLTISIQALRVAMAHPGESLRSE